MVTSYLDIEIYSTDLEETLSLREYFKRLLIALWIEGEDFSGKRPFGNSGWQFEMYSALIDKGIIEGKFDEFGYISEIDEPSAKKFIINIIKEL